ncbi:MAG: CoA transferase [Gammaproteobacteria bacterium]|nr:CoA transferase [Gammaproteobacteria bacterium]
MYPILKGLRIVEGASFIAAPSCALHLHQLGADVIRFDAIGGGPDFHRWPRIEDGPSLYWEGLNKGKKSIALDLRRPEGRELAVRLATAPGENAGLVVTNFPVRGFFSHENLKAQREDIITVRVMGWFDGTTALDYTVNAAVGVPYMTGPQSLEDAPVNHVLPAWDLVTGTYAAMALLAAERHRRLSGEGSEIRVPLGDVAFATMGHLGQIAEVMHSGADRPRLGNDLFGAFGRDFVTGDGQRIMLVALTSRQWTGLVKVLGLGEAVRAVEREIGASLSDDEGLRFAHRERLNALVATALGSRRLDELKPEFDANGVCWGPYHTLQQALESDDSGTLASPLFESVQHPSGLRYPTPGASATFEGRSRAGIQPAPRLGEHTDQILAEVLDLPEHEIARLHDQGLVAGAEENQR